MFSTLEPFFPCTVARILLQETHWLSIYGHALATCTDNQVFRKGCTVPIIGAGR